MNVNTWKNATFTSAGAFNSQQKSTEKTSKNTCPTTVNNQKIHSSIIFGLIDFV